jgi:hypothetical protein
LPKHRIFQEAATHLNEVSCPSLMSLSDVLQRSTQERGKGQDTAKDDGDVLPKIELRLSHSY